MSNRVRHEKPAVTLTKACQTLFPNRVNVATARRWALTGVRGFILETFLLGRDRYATPQAVERFLRRINGESLTELDSPACSPPPTDQVEVERELVAEGV
jgi:hypothetical protein